MPYQTKLPWSEEKTETLIIHCSDHRFQTHIDEFIREELKRKSFDRLVFPGGPQFLLASTFLPKFEWAGKRWVKYLIKQHGIKEVICIAHENCGWYRNVTIGYLSFTVLKDRQIEDLRKARHVLREMFPEIKVGLFYAHLRENKNVECLPIES
jgi:hypothetical protein